MRIQAWAVFTALVLILISSIVSSAMERVDEITTVILPLPPQQIQDESVYLATASVRDIECLAENLYHEARGEGKTGMIAVAFVTVNRVESDYWPRSGPDTVCGVVYEGRRTADGTYKRHQCQFSWVCDGKPDEVRDLRAWYTSLDIAREVLVGEIETDPTHGAAFYHAMRVNPDWASSSGTVKTTVVGRHVFYRFIGWT